MIEEAVITKIVETGDLKTAINLGVTEDHFGDIGNKLVYRKLCNYYRAANTRGNVPTREWLTATTPFAFEQVAQDLSALCVELHERYVRTSVMQICSEAMEAVQGTDDPSSVLYSLRDKMLKVEGAAPKTDDLSYIDSIEKQKEWYQQAKEAKGVTGVPFPWETLTKKSGGMDEGNLFLFYGRPKQMKTWVALDICANAFLNHGLRVLIFAWEQTPKELTRRLSSIFSKLDYSRVKSGQLTEEEERIHWFAQELIQDSVRSMDGRKDQPLLYVSSSVDPEGGAGVDNVRRKIETVKPDLVLVDGLYNMADQRERKKSMKWTNQGALIDDLKATARSHKVPVLATTQANRTGEDPTKRGTSDVAFSDGAGMWADALIKVVKKKEDGETYIILDVRAAREFDMDGIKIHASPGGIFDEVEVLGSEEAVLKEVGGLVETPQINRSQRQPQAQPATANDIAMEAAEHLQRNDWS